MKIGITERGNAGIDISWADKLNTVDGAIIISKYLSDELIQKLVTHQKKIIFHCTCTGYGGTVLEPNVPDVEWTHEQLFKLIKAGFDPSHIVLRADPIIPTQKGIDAFETAVIFAPVEIKRTRISVLDMYPHVQERFKTANLPLPYGNKFSPSSEQIALVNASLERMHATQFEACAEKGLKSSEGNLQHIGCISEKDLQILGLSIPENSKTGTQRAACLCLNCKTELLAVKHPCKNGCLYCYWKN